MASWIVCVVHFAGEEPRVGISRGLGHFYILTFPFRSLILLAGGRESPAPRAVIEAKWLIHEYALLASDADHVAGCQR
jgi:hypothetical protein